MIIYDKEKIVEWLTEISLRPCDFSRPEDYDENMTEDLADGALELLKEQEAVTIKKTKEHGFGVYGGICPKCRNWIQSAHSFCGFCGQKVKWE